MSIFIIKLQRQRKLRPRARAEALQASALAVSPWPLEVSLYLVELQLCSTSVAEGWCGTAVQQLACILPQVVVSKESVEQLLCYVLFGICKSPSWSWKACVSPELGGGNWHQALEQWMQVPQECHAGAGGGVGDNLDHGGTFITLGGKALCSLHGRFGNNSLCCVCIMARSVLVSWVFISLFCSSSLFHFHWLVFFGFPYHSLPSLLLSLPSLSSLTLLFWPMNIHRHIKYNMGLRYVRVCVGVCGGELK